MMQSHTSSHFPAKIAMPVDLAFETSGERREISIEELPSGNMYKDIGRKTIAEYQRIIGEAGTLFVNGPAGVYEEKLFEEGTRAIWKAIAASPRLFRHRWRGHGVRSCKVRRPQRHQLRVHRGRRNGSIPFRQKDFPSSLQWRRLTIGIPDNF